MEIDLAVLERNLKRIRAALPPYIQYIAVVKADAYGHGMAQTVSRLMRSGADMFAVANIGEAAEIREIGSGWPVLVLSALLPGEEWRLAETGCIPSISSREETERFARAAAEAGRVQPVHLKIDTGMGRLGVWHEQAADLCRVIQAAPELRLEGIYTHFSSAGTDPEFTRRQRNLFLKCVSGFSPRKLLIHADNSAGLETFPPGGVFNAVRVGLLQFGVLPYPDSLLAGAHIEPVLSFHTRVGLVKTLPKGTGVSYNRTRFISRQTRAAVLTAGYGDGIPTTASNRAEVLIRGRRCPVLGRVTMDQTIVDATELPEVHPGDQATLIGTQDGETISVAEFSARASHIPWEIFCSITKRVQRIYKTETAT